MDEDVRRLERLAASGDLEAAFSLHRIYKRTGRVRQLIRQRPNYLIELVGRPRVPIVGNVEIHIIHSAQINVSPSYVPNQWGGTSADPIIVYGVPYSIRATFIYNSETGVWEHNEPDDDYRFIIRRTDRPAGQWDATDAGRRAIESTILRMVNEWADANPGILQQAQKIESNNEIIALDDQLDRLIYQQQQAQQQIAEHIIAELGG